LVGISLGAKSLLYWCDISDGFKVEYTKNFFLDDDYPYFGAE